MEDSRLAVHRYPSCVDRNNKWSTTLVETPGSVWAVIDDLSWVNLVIYVFGYRFTLRNLYSMPTEVSLRHQNAILLLDHSRQF